MARVASHLRGQATPLRASVRPPTPREKGADVRTPDRRKIVAAYFELLKGRTRLPSGAMETLKSRFPHLKLTPRTIQRLVKLSKEQQVQQPTSIRLTRRRAGMCGGQGMKFTPELALALVRIDDENWGRLSIKKLTGELKKAGFECSQTSVRNWCKLLGAGRRHKYIKPKLTVRHRRDRLAWVLDKYDRKKGRFTDQHDVCHGDENGFLFFVMEQPAEFSRASRQPVMMLIAWCAYQLIPNSTTGHVPPR